MRDDSQRKYQDGDVDPDTGMRWCKFKKVWCGYWIPDRKQCIEDCVIEHGV